MLSSLARYLEPLPDEEGDAFLTQIQTLFQTEFIAKQLVPDRKQEESGNISSQAVNSDRLADNNETHQNYEAKSDSDQEATYKPSETNSTTVLHMGSVLSTEHDYLLWNPIHLIFKVVSYTFMSIWSMNVCTSITILVFTVWFLCLLKVSFEVKINRIKIYIY